MRRIHIFLPEPLLKALQALATKTDLSIAEHIRRAVEQYLKKQQPK